VSFPFDDNVLTVFLDALRDGANGFNPTLAGLVGNPYQITPFMIDWYEGSENFNLGGLDPENAEMAKAFKRWPAASLYTGELTAITEKSIGKHVQVQVVVHLDFFLYFQALEGIQHAGNVFADTTDLEQLPNATTDAVLTCVFSQLETMQDFGLLFTRLWKRMKSPTTILGDGRHQRLNFIFEFEATIARP
jgi:hypothetical protein